MKQSDRFAGAIYSCAGWTQCVKNLDGCALYDEDSQLLEMLLILAASAREETDVVVLEAGKRTTEPVEPVAPPLPRQLQDGPILRNDLMGEGQSVVWIQRSTLCDVKQKHVPSIRLSTDAAGAGSVPPHFLDDRVKKQYVATGLAITGAICLLE